MPKAWLSFLLGWLIALAANGCSADQRLLGRISSLLSDAGLADVDTEDADVGDADAGDADGIAEVWIPFGAIAPHPAFANVCVGGVGLCASHVDPTMTADELELYFASNPNTDWDIWLVKRETKTAAWGPAGMVDQLSSTSLDETPEVSADGLTIYLASERPGGVAPGRRLWVSHRAKRTDLWQPPTPVTDFTTGGDQDTSPSLQKDQLMMAFASLHGGDWDLYMTTRQSTADRWGPPTLLAELNSTSADWDPALYQGGTSIVFASQRLGNRNSLFYATRATVTERFSVPQPAKELNVNGEGDPWLSDDGHHILFDSHRASGAVRIYEAWR